MRRSRLSITLVATVTTLAGSIADDRRQVGTVWKIASCGRCRTLGSVTPVVIRNNRLATRQTIGFTLLILLSAAVTLAPLLAILTRASGAGLVVVLVLLVPAAALIGFLAYCVVRSWRQRAVLDERGILVSNLLHTPFVPWSQLAGMYTDASYGRGGQWHVAVLTLRDGTQVRVRVTYARDRSPAHSFADQVRALIPGEVPS